MNRRSVDLTLVRRAAVLAAATALLAAAPAAAQLARPRIAAPDAPKLLVVPFQREHADSAMSLLIADGLRDRMRTAHLTRFNTIQRNIMNENLVQSGFPTDVPLDNTVERQLARFLNVRFLVEGTLIRRSADSLLVVARLEENVQTRPQSVTASVVVTRARAGTATGAELANRLVDGFRSFDDVMECRRAVEQQNWARAVQKVNDALRDYPSSSAAYLCLADVKRGQSAPQDTLLAVLTRAAEVDSLNSLVLRQLARIYEDRSDTTALLGALRRILRLDVQENDLRIGTARLFAAKGMIDSAAAVLDEGLAENPNSAALLNAKAVALAAGNRWTDAVDAMEHVAEVDSMLIDSAYAFRMTNYLLAIPDSARYLTWLRIITERLPLQPNYWYSLGEVLYIRGDTAGAVRAAGQYLQLRPQDVRGHLAAARYELGARMYDSALAHLAIARQDSSARPFAAPLYLQAGLQSYRDSAWATAIERLTLAREYAQGGAVVPAAFFLGLSQVQLGVRVDNEAQTGRNCDAARRAQELWQGAEQNIIAGAAFNREAANNLLSQVIPAYKQRADAMTQQYCR